MLQNKRNVITWFCALSMVFTLMGCNREDDPIITKEVTVHTLPVVEVMNEELLIYYTTIGSVISDDRIQITSRITGYIDEVQVRESNATGKTS